MECTDALKNDRKCLLGWWSSKIRSKIQSTSSRMSSIDFEIVLLIVRHNNHDAFLASNPKVTFETGPEVTVETSILLVLFCSCHSIYTHPTPHPPAQPAPCRQPECRPSSSPYYHGTAISNHPHPPACSTTTSSDACAALAAGSPCTPSWHATHGCSTGTECRQCRGSCVVRA
jgi:hypothetical protein